MTLLSFVNPYTERVWCLL